MKTTGPSRVSFSRWTMASTLDHVFSDMRKSHLPECSRASSACESTSPLLLSSFKNSLTCDGVMRLQSAKNRSTLLPFSRICHVEERVPAILLHVTFHAVPVRVHGVAIQKVAWGACKSTVMSLHGLVRITEHKGQWRCRSGPSCPRIVRVGFATDPWGTVSLDATKPWRSLLLTSAHSEK